MTPWLRKSGFSGWSELQMDLLSSKGLTRESCLKQSVRSSHWVTPGPKSGARSEGFAEWSWATAESELFDSGSKMSGRSKCTAGGDEGSTKCRGKAKSHASHKHTVDIQSHTDAIIKVDLLGCLYMTLSLHISYPEIKCYSIKSTLKNVSTEWLIQININCSAKVLISYSVREKNIERFHHCSFSLLSPAPIASPQIRPPRWDEGSFILQLIVTNETGW